MGLLGLEDSKAEAVWVKWLSVGPAKLEGHVWLGQEGGGVEARLCPRLVMIKQDHLTKDSGWGGRKDLVGPRSHVGPRTPGRWAPLAIGAGWTPRY